MANIAWVNQIRIINLSLVASIPGQIRHEIVSTGSVKVYNQAAGRWAGSVQFGRVDSPEIGRRIEALISALNGSQHTTDLPIANIKGAAPNTTLATAQIGQYYNFGNRLILVNGRSSGKTLHFPQINIAEDSVLTSANRLRIRLTNAQTLMPHTPDNQGPWALAFTEAIE